MSKLFKVYTRAIILNGENEVLMMKKTSKQKYGAGNYLLPGGTAEFGENIEETLIREIKEETNLIVNSLTIVDTRKMIINNEHWLGIYYYAECNNLDELNNNEPEKHDFCGFVDINNIGNFLHKDMILNFLSGNKNINIRQDTRFSNRDLHTMGVYLDKYIDIKIHHLLKESKYNYVKVRGLYDRKNSEISKYEKNDKLFNYKRPTAILEEDTVIVNCFPGDSYVKHYNYLINSFLKINNIEAFVTYELPSEQTKRNAFNKYDFSDLQNSDYVILGHVDKIGVLENIKYKSMNDFKYKIGNINGKKVSLLGTEFSLRGDIGAYLIKKLSTYGIKNIIYIGKVGGIKDYMTPNEFIATGNSSLLNGKTIVWDNIFSGLNDKNIIYGKHINSDSIILEDINWLNKNKNYDFVDPEIGYFADSAIKNGLGFSYIHIISNNLSNKLNKENLSNERKKEIIKKRKKIFKQIGNILLNAIY